VPREGGGGRIIGSCTALPVALLFCHTAYKVKIFPFVQHEDIRGVEASLHSILASALYNVRMVRGQLHGPEGLVTQMGEP
jgi:hypothetical protein